MIVQRYALLQIRARRVDNFKRILEVVAVVSFTVAAIFLLAYSLGTCVDVPSWNESGYGFTFYCTDGRSSDCQAFFKPHQFHTH